MTCIEKFWLEHPDLTPKGKCPHDYGYLPRRPYDCYEISCFNDCWMQEPIEKNGNKKGETACVNE